MLFVINFSKVTNQWKLNILVKFQETSSLSPQHKKVTQMEKVKLSCLRKLVVVTFVLFDIIRQFLLFLPIEKCGGTLYLGVFEFFSLFFFALCFPRKISY